MEKFTKYKKNEENQEETNIVYDGYIKVIQENEWEFVVEKDCVVCLPYVVDEGYFLMRSEPVPPWTYDRKSNSQQLSSHYLTMVSGTIEDGETPHTCLRRELYEEAGIILNEFKQLNIEGPFYMTKGNTAKYYLCLLELNYNDFKLVSAPGDGSKTENISKTMKVSLGDIDEIRLNDMISLYLVNKLKTENNI